MSSELVLYPHIGRTGGDFLANALTRVTPCPKWEHFHTKQQVWEYLSKQDLRSLASLRFLAGHGVYFGLHEQIPVASTYFTLFRNPIDRVISQYYAYRTDDSYDFQQEFLESGITLEDFAAQNPNDHANYVTGYDTYQKKQPSLADLNQIIENLEQHYFLIGTTEKWYATFYLLARYFGAEEPPFYPKTRTNAARASLDEVSSSVKDHIAECNQLDLALYDYASKRLENQIQSLTVKETLEVSRWEKAFRTATELCSNVDFELFNYDFIEYCTQISQVDLFVIESLGDRHRILLLANEFLDLIQLPLDIRFDNKVVVQVPQNTPLTDSLSEEQFALLDKDNSLVIILANAGQSYLIRNPLLERGIPHSRIHSLFREVL